MKRLPAFGFWVLAALGTPAARTASAQRIEKRLPQPGRLDTARLAFGVIDGMVTDTSLTPLEGAQVRIVRTSLRVPTGSNGRFQIVHVPPGEYLVIVRRLGYRPVSAIVQVAKLDTLRLAYALERMAQTLDTVVIAGRRQSLRMAEFEYRRRLGQGEFMTQDEIAARAALQVHDLLRHFRSIDVAPSYTSTVTEYYALSRRGAGSVQGQVTGACAMRVVVDGVPMPTPFNLDLLPSPRELAGIEVYRGSATVPAQYSAQNTGCGVLLIWTKDG